MVFKKSNKKKGKSSKKTKSKHDDWKFDGGQSIQPNENVEPESRIRKTQDWDERIRRSRVKMNDRKRKQQLY
jgi:hypothetical protein